MKYIRREGFVLLAIITCLTGFRNGTSPSFQNQRALYWAALLVKNTNAQNTAYRHQDLAVGWAGIGGAAGYQCFADCSGFINALLKQTYGWDDAYFKNWLGRKRPLAYHYFDAIVAGNQFDQIRSIDAVQPGDLIALKYSDRSEHEDNTGHCMLVVSAPQPCAEESVIEPATRQYAVTVIDCSKSPHGKSDTRWLPDGSEYAGLGEGVFRLYADKKAVIVAYSWSKGKPKPGFDPYGNAVVVGRLRVQ